MIFVAKRKKHLTEDEISNLVRMRAQVSCSVRKDYRKMSSQKKSSMEQHINDCEKCSRVLGDYYFSVSSDETTDMEGWGE